MKLKVAVVFGGRTCEHDVSVISALQAAGALDRESYDVVYVYIDRDGSWYTGDALKDIRFVKNFDPAKVDRVIPAGENGKLRLLSHDPKKKLFGTGLSVLAEADVVLPVMHGMNGEDGTLQGMLEMFNVPYTSAGVMGSAVGMDKIAMKLLFMGCGFPVVNGVWFDRDRWAVDRESLCTMCEEKIGYPMFVKPASLGSSIGINRAVNRDGLEEAVDTACAYDRRILVEKGVENLREVNCAVLGYADKVTASVLEMPVSSSEFLNFADKYQRGEKGGKGMQSLTRRVPAPIGEELTKKVKQLAIDAFKAMDLKGVVRIDFILDAQDNLFINEANTIPGSLAFYLWEPEGIPFSKLLDRMIEHAFEAHADKNRSVFSYDSTILSNLVNGSKGKLG